MQQKRRIVWNKILLNSTTGFANSLVITSRTTPVNTITRYGSSIHIIYHVNHTKYNQQPTRKKKQYKLGISIFIQRSRLKKAIGSPNFSFINPNFRKNEARQAIKIQKKVKETSIISGSIQKTRLKLIF